MKKSLLIFCTLISVFFLENNSLSSANTIFNNSLVKAEGPKITPIMDQTLEAGDIRSILLKATDSNGNDGLSFSLISAPTFLTLQNNVNGQATLIISPNCDDMGNNNVTLQVTNLLGDSSQVSFNLFVKENQPPVVPTFPDTTIKCGQAVTLPIVATDLIGNPLRLSISNAPAFISVSDSGNGQGLLRIAPPCDGTVSTTTQITLTYTDRCGLSTTRTTKVNIAKSTLINSAAYSSGDKLLFLNGTGFGTSAKVTVNGTDVSARITGQTDTSITLKGNKKKLNLSKGANTIVITAGAPSNTFVLNL